MSDVTNIILVFGNGETYSKGGGYLSTGEIVIGEYPIVDAQLNEWLKANGHGPLSKLDEQAGGQKMFTANLYLGAFNNFSVDDFIEAIRSLSWKEPESVQLFIERENDERFYAVEGADLFGRA